MFPQTCVLKVCSPFVRNIRSSGLPGGSGVTEVGSLWVGGVFIPSCHALFPGLPQSEELSYATCSHSHDVFFKQVGPNDHGLNLSKLWTKRNSFFIKLLLLGHSGEKLTNRGCFLHFIILRSSVWPPTTATKSPGLAPKNWLHFICCQRALVECMFGRIQ